MKVRILAIGKIKEKYWKDAIGEYEKRLKPHLKLEVLEGPEEDAPQNLSPKDMEILLKKEGAFFLGKMKETDFHIALDLEGKALTSEEIAKTLETEGMMKGKMVNILIGGSLGIAQEVKDRCHLNVSFGKATFPHQLIRVFLVEQIYRSVKIIKKEPYHK